MHPVKPADAGVFTDTHKHYIGQALASKLEGRGQRKWLGLDGKGDSEEMVCDV